MPNKIVAVLNDLMFTVKIADAAKRAGLTVEYAKTADEAVTKAQGASGMILDLNFAPLELVTRLKTADDTKAIPLIAYLSHVQVDIMREAKQLGCDNVMPRSAFVQNLNAMMQDLAAR